MLTVSLRKHLLAADGPHQFFAIKDGEVRLGAANQGVQNVAHLFVCGC